MDPAEVESLLQIEDSSAEAWCGVFLRLINNSKRINSPEKGEIVCHALLKKVEDIGYKDKDSIWKIICICNFNLWRDRDIPDKFEIPDNFQIPYNFHLPLYETGDRTNPFYKYSVGSFRISRLLKYSLRKSEVKAIRLLLNYGYLHTEIYDLMRDAIDTFCFLRTVAAELPGSACPPGCPDELYNRLDLLHRRDFTKVHGCENLRVYQRGFPRIMLVAICIRVLENQNMNPEQCVLARRKKKTWSSFVLYPEYLQCLRLYFRAVPDPFVEADEVGELLRFFLFDVGKDYVDGLVRDFKRLYPESEGPFRPRSLKHLCRCAIRQKLCDRSKVLPVLLDDLRLPRSLKMYIMGDL